MKILLLIIFIICIFLFFFTLYSSYNECKTENKKLKDELKDNEKTSKEKEV
jgi:preprotein translocase subunit YajC